MNKNEEKEILRMVYAEEDYTIKAEINERPDFILVDKRGMSFGVEITEYFNSQSAARLIKVPNYTDRILRQDISDNDRFIHKNDKDILKVDMLTFLAEDGSLKFETRGIIQQSQSRLQFLDNILKVIQEKNEKGKFYNTNIAYTDLVIFDRSGSFTLEELDLFYENFYSSSIVSILQSSVFKEISIVIFHKEDNYFLKLKSHLLLCRIYLFLCFYVENEQGVESELSIQKFIIDLLYCLEKDGFNEVGVHYENGKFELLYGHTGFGIINDTQLAISVNLYDFLKTPIYKTIKDFLQYGRRLPDESLFINFKDYLNIKSFRLNGAFLCRKQ